ncbi:MAG: hemerythrin family protein [Bacteroidales bacterium]|nr:hemerythrin family protein [Bacteroidales bacterium]MBN2817352.1 hemerythrin family protein [Bacteroidales bacterium]
MAKVFWKNEYSVGIETIDNQHKHLFEIINNFYSNLSDLKNSQALLPIIAELKDYASYHFRTEEALMGQFNFIGLRKHIAEHEAFKKKVAEFEEKVKTGKLLLSLAVTGFIEEWITNHIKSTDMDYSGFLRSRGVK